MDSCCIMPIDVFEGDSELQIEISDFEFVSLELDATGYPIYPETYTGTCNIVPTMQKQVLKTKGLTLLDDVTIEKIPNCYGLITWNGSFITVS